MTEDESPTMSDGTEDDSYPPDEEEDSDGYGPVPVPRAQAIRKSVLARQTKPAKIKGKSVSKGGGRILAKEKQRKALEMRKAGMPYQVIAEQLGYSDQSGARKAVLKAFGDIVQEPALEVRTLQVERLNHMLLTLWGKVQQGDERAIDTSLRVMDKLDRLMGTEAAQSIDVNVHQTGAILVIDGSKDDFIRAAKQMAGLTGDGSNVPQTAIAPPSGVIDGTVVDELPYVPVDGSLADALGPEGIETIHNIMAPPDPPKKTYDFGVDP